MHHASDTLPHRLRTSLLVSLTSRPRANTLTRPLIIHPVTHIFRSIGVVVCALAIHLVTLPLALGESNNALPILSLMHHASPHSTTPLANIASRIAHQSATCNTPTRPLIIHPVTHILPAIGEVVCALAISLVTLPLALGESNNTLPILSLMHHASRHSTTPLANIASRIVTSRPRVNTLARPLIIHPVTHILPAIGEVVCALAILLSPFHWPSASPTTLFPSSVSCTTHHDPLPHHWRTLLLVSLTSRPRHNTLTRLLIIHPVTHILSPVGEVECAPAISLVTFPLALGESNNALLSLSLMHHASRHSITPFTNIASRIAHHSATS